MLYYLLKSLIVWMLSCYSEISPFAKALFSSPWWVMWCSPAPGLWFCGYLAPAPFLAWFFFAFLSSLCPQVCGVPLSPFFLENILPPLLKNKQCLSVQPEFWDSQWTLHKSCILLMQLERLNITTHQTLAGKEKRKRQLKPRHKLQKTSRDWAF